MITYQIYINETLNEIDSRKKLSSKCLNNKKKICRDKDVLLKTIKLTVRGQKLNRGGKACTLTFTQYETLYMHCTSATFTFTDSSQRRIVHILTDKVSK